MPMSEASDHEEFPLLHPDRNRARAAPLIRAASTVKELEEVRKEIDTWNGSPTWLLIVDYTQVLSDEILESLVMVDSPYLERLARRTDLPVDAATTLCLLAIEHGLERYSRYYVDLCSSLAIQLLPRTYFGPGQDEFAERILGAIREVPPFVYDLYPFSLLHATVARTEDELLRAYHLMRRPIMDARPVAQHHAATPRVWHYMLDKGGAESLSAVAGTPGAWADTGVSRRLVLKSSSLLTQGVLDSCRGSIERGRRLLASCSTLAPEVCERVVGLLGPRVVDYVTPELLPTLLSSSSAEIRLRGICGASQLAGLQEEGGPLTRKTTKRGSISRQSVSR